MTFPLSPVRSECDSLADIDDLDAFLASKGPLSRWGTPPLEHIAAAADAAEFEEEYHGSAGEDGTLDRAYLRHISSDTEINAAADAQVAATFERASPRNASLAGETDVVHSLLRRAQLPPEVLALSYNILTAYTQRLCLVPCPHTYPLSLLTVSALALAVAYTNDYAPNSSWWSYRVCKSLWTAQQIDNAMLSVLATLDWSLFKYGSPPMLDCATNVLLKRAPATRRDQQAVKPPPLTISIEDATACWVGGQLTPNSTPPSSAKESPPQQGVHPTFFFS